MSKKKIAIYSGDIPSTTFIENLIKSIAEDNFTVLLFGVQKKHVTYKNQNISVYPTPVGIGNLILFVLWNRIKLFLINRPNYNILRTHIDSGNFSFRKKFKLWARYLPVILNLPDIFHIQWAKSLNDWMFLKSKFGVKIILSLRGAHINYSPIADVNLATSYRKNFPLTDDI